MLRAAISFVMISVGLAAAAHADPAPVKVHAAAIPDGRDWDCFVWDDGSHHASGCEREIDGCEVALSNAVRGAVGTVDERIYATSPCVAQATAWVATAKRDNGTWARIAAPTSAACATRATAELGQLREVSACVELGRTKPSPPDADLIPAGRGWWCIVPSQRVPIGPQCFRAHTDCPGPLVPRSTACRARATAWLYTRLDSAQAFRDRASCDRDRLQSLDRSACVEMK